MVEPLLYFTLGFLMAAFLAALVTPAVWRRAVTLTRRGIEASVPLSREEILAERDSLRAEHAIVARRLEMEVKSLKQRMAEQTVDLAKDRQEMAVIAAERDALKQELLQAETGSRDWQQQVQGRDDRVQAVSAALDKAETALEAKQGELAALSRQLEETSLVASSRQIELVARESELDQLRSDLAALKGQRRNAEKLQKDDGGKLNLTQQAAREHKRRAEQLDLKLQSLISDLSDRDDRLERRNREIARLRERLNEMLSATSERTDEALIALRRENLLLEAEVERLSQPPATESAEPPQSVAARLAMVQRENRHLRDRITAQPDGEEATRETRQLRDQIMDLAAQVVAMTARIEGPGSPIEDALARPGPEGRTGTPSTVSLADRIRALRQSPVSSQPVGQVVQSDG